MAMYAYKTEKKKGRGKRSAYMATALALALQQRAWLPFLLHVAPRDSYKKRERERERVRAVIVSGTLIIIGWRTHATSLPFEEP